MYSHDCYQSCRESLWPFQIDSIQEKQHGEQNKNKTHFRICEETTVAGALVSERAWSGAEAGDSSSGSTRHPQPSMSAPTQTDVFALHMVNVN